MTLYITDTKEAQSSQRYIIYFKNGIQKFNDRSLSRLSSPDEQKKLTAKGAKKKYIINIPTEEGSQNKWRTACLSNEIFGLIEILSEFQFARTFCPAKPDPRREFCWALIFWLLFYQGKSSTPLADNKHKS